MQATKQQHSSPNAKKSTTTANSATSNRSVDQVKSVAQRVMDVATINGVPNNQSTVVSIIPSSSTSVTVQKKSTSSNGSVDNDREVETITNLATKLDLQKVTNSNGNQVKATNDQNNNTKTTDCQTISMVRQSDSSSPSLLLDNSSPLISPTRQTSTNTQQPFGLLTNGLACKENVFTQLTSSHVVDKANLEHKDSSRISLETKVPLPSTSDFQTLRVEDEVSYYNDGIAIQVKPNGQELDVTHKQSSKMMDAVKNEPISGIFGSKTMCTSQHSKQQHSRQASSSRDYLNDVDEDYDEYSTRYLNAMVEEPSKFALAENTAYNARSGSLSIPNSPKAKSAPATPCNVTPTAFHQHTSHLNSMLNPSPANTLPPDIRKNLTCRVLPSSIGHSRTTSANYLDELVRRGESFLEAKDYVQAIIAFSQCIELATNNQNIAYLKKNFKVYSQRAEAHFNLGNYNEAIDDSMAARELNPKWTQAYYLQGKAQFRIGQYADSLAIFSFGLAQDPIDKHLFDALVDAALNSSFKQEFEPKYNKLKSLDLDKRPFIIVSVLGQELLAKGHGEHAAIILESALKLGPDKKKFRSSVLSSIAFAYCLIKDYDKAITYMNKELEIESELEDIGGQCRVLSNLGYTYYKMRKLDKSLESHRKQFHLAMKSCLYPQASVALNAIGHIHAARNNFTCALTSHSSCLEILKLLGDNEYSQFKELLSIGYIHLMLNDFKSAEEKYNEADQLVRGNSTLSDEECHTGLIMVNFNRAYLALKKQLYRDAIQYYSEVIKLVERFSKHNPKRALIEMRAQNGMGHTYRLTKRFEEARRCFDRQLRLSETLNNHVGQSQALCNLGMTYQHFKDNDSAWDMFKENLRLVDKDPLLKAYAHSYIGSMYFLTNRYNEAQAHYETSLNIFKEFEHCQAERKTIELNMAAVHERRGHTDVDSASQTLQRKILKA